MKCIICGIKDKPRGYFNTRTLVRPDCKYCVDCYLKLKKTKLTNVIRNENIDNSD